MRLAVLILPPFFLCDSSYAKAIAERALLLVPPRSRDKLALTHPSFSPTAVLEEFLADSSLKSFTTHLQPKPFTCRIYPDFCLNGKCLYEGLRSVYGNMIGISSSVSIVPSISALLGLAISSSHPFNLGFETDGAGRQSFVQHGNSDLATLGSFFDSRVLTAALVESIDAKTLSIEFFRELETLSRAGEGNALGAVYGSGIQRWLDETSADVCEIYELYRSPRNRDELQASLVVGEGENLKFLEIGKRATTRGLVRVAVLLHLLANKWASETDGSKNVPIFVGVVIVAGIVYYMMKFNRPNNFMNKYN